MRRERRVALASLIAVTALAWLYLWHEAATMGAMDMMSMPMSPVSSWSPRALLLTFSMWAVMMAGMMLPSAAPAVLLYGAMVRANAERGRMLASVWVFAAGYVAVWAGFSVVATLAQAALQQMAWLTPGLSSASPWLSGGLLVGAGVYQWLPVKHACLEKCRNPLQFFVTHWRGGAFGGLRMGAAHGAYCLGCCWALMCLLFVVGVMNLLGVALIAAFIFVEKLLPAPRLMARVAGVLLAAVGVLVIASRS